MVTSLHCVTVEILVGFWRWISFDRGSQWKSSFLLPFPCYYCCYWNFAPDWVTVEVSSILLSFMLLSIQCSAEEGKVVLKEHITSSWNSAAAELSAVELGDLRSESVSSSLLWGHEWDVTHMFMLAHCIGWTSPLHTMQRIWFCKESLLAWKKA